MSGFVYFAHCGNQIKIGQTLDIAKRMSSLATGNPFPITLIAAITGSRWLERAIHARLRSYRLSGEWFRDHEDVRNLITDLQARGAAAIGFKEEEWKPQRRDSCSIGSSFVVSEIEEDDLGEIVRWGDLTHELAELCREHSALVAVDPEAKRVLRAAYVKFAMLEATAEHRLGDPGTIFRSARELVVKTIDGFRAMAGAPDRAVAAVPRKGRGR